MINCTYATFRDVGLENLNQKSRDLTNYVKHSDLSNYVLLNTCNRSELYSTDDIECNGFRKAEDIEAAKHLFVVACGLDSMVLGENEILGQVRQAYKTARSEGHCSKILSNVFESACRLGGRVRAKTKISDGKTSIASLAVDYVLGQDQYPVGEVLVVGSGTMGSKIACALKNKKIKQIFLANRRMERAKWLAEKVGGKVVDYGRISEFLGKTSVVFTATGAPHPIIRPEMLSAGARVLFVDLGMPYDVSDEVGDLENAEVVRLDYFRGIAEKNALKKGAEVRRVEEMIEENLRGRYGLIEV